MIEDLSKTIKAQLYERVSSPLLSSFSLSWAGWNYKFLLIVFSSMPTKEKLAFIELFAFPTIQSTLLNGIAFPLLTALVLIFIYPIPAKYIYEYTRKRQRELKEIQQRIDDESPLTKEEARQIKRDALKASEEYEQKLERRSIEITRLKELVADLESQLAAAHKEQKPESSPTSDNDLLPLNANQLAILKEIADSSKAIPEQNLINSSVNQDVSLTTTRYNLDELLRRQFIRTNLGAYSATPAGRAYLVEKMFEDVEGVTASVPVPTISRMQPA